MQNKGRDSAFGKEHLDFLKKHTVLPFKMKAITIGSKEQACRKDESIKIGNPKV